MVVKTKVGVKKTHIYTDKKGKVHKVTYSQIIDKIRKKKTLDRTKLIKAKGIQVLTQSGFIDTHYTEDGTFFQKRKNTKTFYLKPKSGKSGFGRGYEVKYSNVCSYLKNGQWMVI